MPDVREHPTRPSGAAAPVTQEIGPGVRLHLLRDARFHTALCRVTFPSVLGPRATETAVLAEVLQAATAKHPTRQALAHRLADLYGASLSLSVGRVGDRQVLGATLEWPTRGVGSRARALGAGLSLLREVLSEPKLGPHGLDEDLVAAEVRNHGRRLAARRDDKARYAAQRCLALACAGEPYALDPMGRAEDLPSVDAAGLRRRHEALLARAPVEIFLVADLGPRDAARAIGRHLLWDGRSSRPAALPRAASVRAPRDRPRRVVETDQVVQGKLAMAWRAAVGPRSALRPAAQTLAGVVGGGSWSRFFKIVRETHGLAYYASAGWHAAKGLLLVQSGVDPQTEPAARRMLQSLVREVGRGELEPDALEGFRQAVTHHVEALADDPAGRVAWLEERTALGLRETPEGHLARLRAVRPADVRRVGRRLGLEAGFLLTREGA